MSLYDDISMIRLYRHYRLNPSTKKANGPSKYREKNLLIPERERERFSTGLISVKCVRFMTVNIYEPEKKQRGYHYLWDYCRKRESSFLTTPSPIPYVIDGINKKLLKAYCYCYTQ